ncbi:MAG: MFS transporter [Deltaproteobacteria bacterium]|nr:MFS transporter [Deltaproteobacteria bacterium]
MSSIPYRKYSITTFNAMEEGDLMNTNAQIQYPGFRWFVLTTLCIVTATSAMIMIAPTPIIEAISKTMGLSRGEVSGITMVTFNLFLALSAIAGGALIDRFGVLRVWFACLILLIAGVALVPYVGDTGRGMTLIRVLMGCGTGPIMAAIVTVAAQWFPMKERGIVTGIQGFSVSLGIFLGFRIVPQLFTSTGNWQTAFAWLNVGNFAALILTLIVALGPRPPLEKQDTVEAPQTGGSDFRLALLQIATWAGIACGFLNSWEYQAFNDLIPNYLAIDPPVGIGLGVIGAGNLMSICTIAYMIGSILSGVISEKFFSGRSMPVVILGFLISAVFAFAVKYPYMYSNKTILLVCLILIGFWAAVINPQVCAFIAKNYPEHISGKIAGIAMALFGFGATLGLSAGSYALHKTGLYMMSINLVAAAALLGVIAAFFMKPPKVFSK